MWLFLNLCSHFVDHCRNIKSFNFFHSLNSIERWYSDAFELMSLWAYSKDDLSAGSCSHVQVIPARSSQLHADSLATLSNSTCSGISGYVLLHKPHLEEAFPTLVPMPPLEISKSGPCVLVHYLFSLCKFELMWSFFTCQSTHWSLLNCY